MVFVTLGINGSKTKELFQYKEKSKQKWVQVKFSTFLQTTALIEDYKLIQHDVSQLNIKKVSTVISEMYIILI